MPLVTWLRGWTSSCGTPTATRVLRKTWSTEVRCERESPDTQTQTGAVGHWSEAQHAWCGPPSRDTPLRHPDRSVGRWKNAGHPRARRPRILLRRQPALGADPDDGGAGVAGG